MTIGKDTYRAMDVVIKTLIAEGAKTATKYLTQQLIVRATRRAYNKKFPMSKVEILVTIGKPNWRERDYAKTCRLAGEPFPVKKIQLKFLAKNKKK